MKRFICLDDRLRLGIFVSVGIKYSFFFLRDMCNEKNALHRQYATTFYFFVFYSFRYFFFCSFLLLLFSFLNLCTAKRQRYVNDKIFYNKNEE